jgi:hypothetical protein
MSLTEYDLMFNPHLIQPVGTRKGVLNKPNDLPLKIDPYDLFLAHDNVNLLCVDLYKVYQQNGGQSSRDKFRDLVLLLQHKFIKSNNLHLYTTAEWAGTGLINYVEVLRSINEEFNKLVFDYFKWDVYNPFHDLAEVSDLASGKRYLKKGSELTPDDYGTLDLWRNQITQVSNKNFRNCNKIPVYQAGLHTRNYDRDNEGLKYVADQSSKDNHIHGYDMRIPRKSALNYKSDEWFGFF